MTGKLVVSLIDNDQTTRRFQQHNQLFIAHHAPGRIIRRANDRDIRLRFLDLFQQRCQIKLKLTIERNTHDVAAQYGRDLPVKRKGWLGNENALPFSNGHHQ